VFIDSVKHELVHYSNMVLLNVKNTWLAK